MFDSSNPTEAPGRTANEPLLPVTGGSSEGVIPASPVPADGKPGADPAGDDASHGIPASTEQHIPVQTAASSVPISPFSVNGAKPVLNKPAVMPSEVKPGPAVQRPVPVTKAAAGILPDVMAAGRSTETTPEHETHETIEHQVNRLRPKTLRLQLRFLWTLLFALWLFGRLVFWQIYVAQFFPDWVNRRSIPRWQKYARQFRAFAVRMGGVMIKAGQFASTRADILPEEIIAELASLQDEVPSIPYPFIRDVLERELGVVSEHFASIEDIPVAAASLGQVYQAQLLDGQKVVVKVQRPGIREIVYTDMAALFMAARIAMRFHFVRRRADMVSLTEEFGRVLVEEISYLREAQHAERFKAMYSDDMGVYIPAIHHEHSTDYVLTMEDVTAIKINDYEGLEAAGINRKEVARRLMDTYMRQIFAGRFFHADPHPGNLFIYPLPVDDASPYINNGGGRPFYLVFVDFGMTGALTQELVQGLIDTLTAIITRDAKKLVKSYQELGFLLPGADTKRIEEAAEVVFQQVWGMSMADMRMMDFSVARNIGREFGDLLYDMPFRVPQDFIYLGRTVGILSGMATALDPEFNPWTEIQQHVQKLITTNPTVNLFDELGQWLAEPFKALFAGDMQGFWQGILALIKRFQQPNKIEIMLQKIVDGDVAVVTKLSPQHRRQLERIEIQAQRTTRAVIFATFMITGTMFYTSGDTGMATGAYLLAAITLISMVFIRQ